MQHSNNCFFRYLPDNDRAFSYPVNVIGAGRFVAHRAEQYPPTGHPSMYQFDWQRGRRLPEFQVLLLTDGGGEFESETTGLLRFEGPALIVLFPGIWHRYRPMRSCGWVERWLSFNGEIAYSLFDFRVSAAQFALTSPADATPLVEHFDDLLEDIQSNTPIDAGILAFRALRIIVESACFRQQAIREQTFVMKAQLAAKRASDPVVRRALEIIWSHGSHPSVTVGEIARRMRIARRTLDKRFACTLGYSVLTEIQNCRMSRAKRLLQRTALPIKQVAFLAGYPNSERMRVAFQQTERMNPLDFRRKSDAARGCSMSHSCDDHKPSQASNHETPCGCHK